MKHRLSYYTVVLFLFCYSISQGQTGNPFDIEKRSTPLTIISPDSTTLESLPEVQELIKDTIQERSFVEKRQYLIIEENPFNVTRIPISVDKREPKPKVPIEDPVKVENREVDAQELITLTQVPKVNKFLFWFFLLQLLLISSLLGINREFISKISRSISNDNFAKLVSRDYNGGFNALFLFTYLLFVFSLTIFIYLAVRHYFLISGFSNFLLILITVSVIYLIRHFFLGFLGFVFPFTKTISYYSFMIILFNSYLGLLLIPLNVVIAYAPGWMAISSLYIGFGLIILMYLLRMLRGSLYAYTLIRKYVFHFFLYLCTCEIAPILILVKFLNNSFS